MSRKAGTLLALMAVGAVAVAGYEVAHHFGGGTVAPDAAATGTPVPGPSSVPAPSPVDASPSAAATSTAPTTAPVVSSVAPTPATNAPVQVTGSSVPVSVTFYGWNGVAHEVEVGGYVAGVIESGGTCTLTLTKGGTSVTAQRPAAADATTTTCGEIDVPGSRLSSGTWTAVLSYRSARHAGAAAPVQVAVTS